MRIKTRQTDGGIKDLHSIVIDNALNQMLFAYVLAATNAAYKQNKRANVMAIIREFCDVFQIDKDPDALKREYYRCRSRYLQQQQIFKKCQIK